MTLDNEGKEKNNVCHDLLNALTNEDIAIFRGVFGNNNSTCRDLLFSNPTVKTLWNKVARTMKHEHAFKDAPNPDLELTYCKITQEVARYGLAVPTFWAKQYPSL